MDIEYENLDTTNINLIKIYDNIIEEIKQTIKLKNIDVLDLCDRLCLTTENLIDILTNKKQKLSIYIDILDTIKEY